MSASAVDLSRRLLLGASGALVAGAAAAQGAAGGQGAGQGAGGQGGGSGGQPPKAAPPRIPNRLTARPDPQLEDEPPLSEDQKVGFAVVGIGKFALEQAIPAFGETKAAKLVGLVSGDPAKGARVARQHGIAPSRVWSYDSFDRIAADPAVQVVYIMTPNSLHADLAVRAFRAGKHVLCEKPMAVTEADCERMIRAAADASRKLMIAYRAQFEPHNLEAVRRIRAGEVGAVRLITSVHGRQLDVRDPADQWRAQAALAGGGSLYDIGIYALNGARYLTGEEPESVTAQISNAPNDPRFAEVEDLIKFQLRFPSGAAASLVSAYSWPDTKRIEVLGEKGVLTLDPATDYEGNQLRFKTEEGEQEVQVAAASQFAEEIDHMARAVITGQPVKTPGEEGLQDVRLMQAIYRAARAGRAVDVRNGYRRAAPVI